MKNGYKILTMFMLVLAMGSISFALMTPLPIVAKIVSEPCSGVVVSITNTRTGETLSGLTNDGCEYNVDWANTISKYSEGDTFRVTSQDFIKEFTYLGAPPPVQYFSFDIPCSVLKTLDYGERLIIKDDKCNIDVTAPEKPICEDCDVCDVCDVCPDGECPEQGLETLIITVLASLLIGGAAAGTGVKFYQKRSGEIARQHKHPSIRGYHDIDIQHRNPKIRHPKGKLTPKYKKDYRGEWKYIG